MDMTLSSSTCGGSGSLILIGVFVAIVWTPPIGLFVLRRHLAGGTGLLLPFKALLIFFSTLSIPFVLLTVFTLAWAVVEIFGDLFGMLRQSW